MNRILEHKWHYASLSIIFILFLISVQVRKEKLALPLSNQSEWVTAHTLITMKVWDERGGPQYFNFNPVYTFDGKGNEAVGNLGGVMGKDRKLYYTSYPPFSFIFAYYGTKLLGGSNLANLRTLGLITHFFCTILIYLIIIQLRAKEKNGISIAALTAASLYLMSTGTLWMHSIIYFSDTCVQLFLILSIYMLLRFLKNNFNNLNRFLTGFAFIIFCGIYTEWLMLFFAFSVVVYLLINYIRSKRTQFLKAFMATVCSTVLALGLTVFQFSSINGFSELVKVSVSKYRERSGWQVANNSEEIFSWSNSHSFQLIENFLNQNFAMVINVFGISFLILIPLLIWKKTRQKVQPLHQKFLIVALLFSSVTLHYLVFFNFNAIHQIASLKTGFFLIMCISIIVLIIEETLSGGMKLVFGALLTCILIPRMIIDTEKFNQLNTPEIFDPNLELSVKILNQMQTKDNYIFVNIYVTPEYIYKTHHNVFQLNDSTQIAHFMEYFNADKALYFHHEKNRPVAMLQLERKNNRVSVRHRIEFEND